MTKTLVTGGAGFIGSHLVDALRARGDSVRVLDNFSTGKAENLADVEGQIELLEGDLRDQAVVEDAIKDVELVFHQAAFVSVPQSLKEPENCLDINVEGTRQLLELCRIAGVRRVVLASSAAVYGENTAVPLQEETRPNLLSPYAASKYITEIFADLFTHQLDLEVVALRYFNVYGPRQNPTSDYAAVIPIFIQRLLDGKQPVVCGDGGQSRDFIYIADVVRANLLAGDRPGAAGQAFNICSGSETSLLELLESLTGVFEQEIHPRFEQPRLGDIYRSVGDPDRAAQILGFKNQVQLTEGLRRTATWMRGKSNE